MSGAESTFSGRGGPPSRPSPPALRAGDDEFERLRRKLEPWARRVSRKLVGRYGLEPEYAEDLLQEAWLGLLQSMPWDELRHPNAYLRGILYHLALDEVRRRMRRPTMSLDGLALEGEPPDGLDEFEALLHRLDGDGQVTQLLSWIERLPEKQRAAICLTRIRGMTIDEAAAELSVHPGTIKSNVSDARGKVLRWAKEAGWDV